MGEQVCVTGKVKALAKATICNLSYEWVESVVQDPKHLDLSMGRYIGPNQCTLHSTWMTCG